MTHLVIVTDRPAFESVWTPVCAQLGAGVEVLHPDVCATGLTHGKPVLIDAGATGYDEDELLSHASLARAMGIPVAVVLPPSHGFAAIEDVLEDVCSLRIARRDDDVPRLIASLLRAATVTRPRFEYLTVSPRGDSVLGVIGDGSAFLLARPCHTDDDATEITGIVISEDALSATVELVSGRSFTLAAVNVAPNPYGTLAGLTVNGLSVAGAPAPSSAGTQAAPTQEIALSSIDGGKLGARIRELRLAAGLTQAELARRTGIHRPNIARVEAGRHTPSLETLARLAAAIGVPTASVLQVGA